MVKGEEELVIGHEGETIEGNVNPEVPSNSVVQTKPCHVLSTPPSERREKEVERMSTNFMC